MTITTQQAVALAREAGFDEKAGWGCDFGCNLPQVERLLKLARNQALEDAAQMLQKTGATLPAKQEHEGGNAVLTGVSISLAAIESLKDNTP